jgi:hypothetical protein
MQYPQVVHGLQPAGCVIEDPVDLLIKKRLVVLTDLPQAAQNKLSERQRMCSDLSAPGDLVADEEDIL